MLAPHDTNTPSIQTDAPAAPPAERSAFACVTCMALLSIDRHQRTIMVDACAVTPAQGLRAWGGTFTPAHTGSWPTVKVLQPSILSLQISQYHFPAYLPLARVVSPRSRQFASCSCYVGSAQSCHVRSTVSPTYSYTAAAARHPLKLDNAPINFHRNARLALQSSSG